MMLQHIAPKTSLPPPLGVLDDPQLPALSAGFLPAFRNESNGQVRLCLQQDGRISCLHMLDSLPATWVAEQDARGRPVALTNEITAGYWRGGEFWTLSELRRPKLDS